MNRLKALRHEKKLTLRELGDKTGIPFPTLSHLENERYTINSYFLTTLSSFFNVTSDYLLGISDIRQNIMQKKDEVNIEEEHFKYALYGEVKDLTPEQKQDILDMVKRMKEIMTKK